MGRAANDCNTFFGGFKHKSEIISITGGYVPENSSDLSSGRRPTSKSDEFFGFTPMVNNIWPPQLFTFSKKVSSISELTALPDGSHKKLMRFGLGAAP